MATMYEDARLCHREAQAFFDLIKDELAIKDFLSVTESALIYPYGVNLAISCELSLKTFFLLKGKEPPRTHMLYAELFDRLSPSEKVASRQLIEPQLSERPGKAADRFDEALKDLEEVFFQWRYVFQYDPSVDVHDLWTMAKGLLD